MSFIKELDDPWFSLVIFGIKTCEAFLNKDDWKRIKNDDIVIFLNKNFQILRKIKIKVIHVSYYLKINKYLESESIKKCLPGINNIKDGVNIYRKYIPETEENNYGIVSVSFYEYNYIT